MVFHGAAIGEVKSSCVGLHIGMVIVVHPPVASTTMRKTSCHGSAMTTQALADPPRKSPKTDSVLEDAFENAAYFGRRAVAVVKATVKFSVDVVSGSAYFKHTLVDLERGLRRRRKVPRQREVAEALEGHRVFAIGRARSTSFPSEHNQFIATEPRTDPASLHRSQSETISSGGVPTLFEETRTLLRQGMRGSQSASVNRSLPGSVASDSSREPSDVSDHDELGEYSEYPGGQASTEAPWRHPWESRLQFSPRSGSCSDQDGYDDARRHRGGAVVPLDDEPLELTHGDGSSGWSPLTEERYAVVYQPSASEARPRSREGPVGQAGASREDDRPLATASRTLPGARPQQRRGCTPLFTADDELLYSEDASLSLFKGLS
ncbi:hypothetical protein FOZ61_003323 [Perkinsus olseni]|uniref:Uncharacterized protein n=1 Tax=Perkinsus olseni TaxID=32597 RepID=A0A7J6MDS3_PEROL|nr:hypothetical protein FOZ61_003323 [Perkinsus olseni]